MRTRMCVLTLALLTIASWAQENRFEKLDFVMGSWKGTGSGFGNTTSTIESEFNMIMDGQYIEVKNDSKFESTEKNPNGERHIDWGIISYDKHRAKIIYRQFNNEGYVNRYVLNDSLSNETTLVFETVDIENFVEGGKARYTLTKISGNEIETVFEVSFPGQEFACFGMNKLKR